MTTTQRFTVVGVFHERERARGVIEALVDARFAPQTGSGAATGAVSGALVGMGVPEEHAESYEGEVTSGQVEADLQRDWSTRYRDTRPQRDGNSLRESWGGATS